MSNVFIFSSRLIRSAFTCCWVPRREEFQIIQSALLQAVRGMPTVYSRQRAWMLELLGGGRATASLKVAGRYRSLADSTDDLVEVGNLRVLVFEVTRVEVKVRQDLRTTSRQRARGGGSLELRGGRCMAAGEMCVSACGMGVRGGHRACREARDALDLCHDVMEEAERRLLEQPLRQLRLHHTTRCQPPRCALAHCSLASPRDLPC